MKAVVSRVKSASVTVSGTQISSIGRGLLILVGISTHDEQKDLEQIVAKVLALKVFDGEEGGTGGGWKQNVVDIDGEVLCGESSTGSKGDVAR